MRNIYSSEIMYSTLLTIKYSALMDRITLEKFGHSSAVSLKFLILYHCFHVLLRDLLPLQNRYAVLVIVLHI